ncbi:MAG: MMPL family transporter [Gammaproteobacteria bacterium]|nr:MMPL family transporter [Gammaproteobacteria bacterium]
MIAHLERLVFGHRRAVIAVFTLVTAFMVWSASGLRVDAGFAKLLPLEHEYMRTFVEHRQEFGGANRVVVALMAREGDIFTPHFFRRLEQVTDEVFFIPGVDRSQVYSLFTPNVRFTEVTERGIEGGDVVPADFAYREEDLARVRENVLKAGIVGRLVANDLTGAVVSAQLLELDPDTGERLDYIEVARELEEIRARFSGTGADADSAAGDAVPIDIHIIGFAKVVGDIAAGATRVVLFFGITLLITAALVWLYSQSPLLTLIPLSCSIVAVIWQLGLLTLLGYGIDPMSILVPFLIFAIGVSHAVQMVSAVRSEVYHGLDREEAARRSFRRLLLPGGIALASDTVGFITILLIDIRIIQEMAITASLGVAVIILTNLILLPVLLSYVHHDERYRAGLVRRADRLATIWRWVARVASPRPALAVIGVSLLLAACGLWRGAKVEIGDLHRGVPELRDESVYNVDSRIITEHFSIGVDVLTVITETPVDGCVDYEIMRTIDDLAWRLQNTPGVQSVAALPGVAKLINAGWNEGNLNWRVLSRNRDVLAQSVAPIPSSSGLRNQDCSIMPLNVYTADHKAGTIARIVDVVKDFEREHGTEEVTFRLATGNVGVMAATNEEVKASQFPIVGYVFAAVIALCLITFRSLRGTVCIVAPLALVSLLAYALMATLEIGLKVSTLPVVALGVGIGVDYGIYIYSRLASLLEEGRPLASAYELTLMIAGSGVIFTGATLALGVGTWIFAPLKFQADMGILLTFMFLVNMLGAIALLPALACWLGVDSKGSSKGS